MKVLIISEWASCIDTAGFWGDWLPAPPCQTLTVAWGEIGGPRFPQGEGMDKWRENGEEESGGRMEMRQGVGWGKAREAFLLKEETCKWVICRHGEDLCRVASGPRGSAAPQLLPGSPSEGNWENYFQSECVLWPHRGVSDTNASAMLNDFIFNTTNVLGPHITLMTHTCKH